MDEEITRSIVRERLKSYSVVAYSQVSSLMLSGIFALAAMSLLDILRSPDHRILRLSFWFLLAAGEIVAASMQMQRPALMMQSGVNDVPVLVFRGLVTLLAFAVIAPQSGGEDGWRYAYILGPAFAWSSGKLGADFAQTVQQQRWSADIAPALKRVVAAHALLLPQIPIVIAVVAALCGVTLFAPRDWLISELIPLVYNILASALILFVGVRIQREWRAFERAVDNSIAETGAATAEPER